MRINVGLLERVMSHIEQNPEQHYQPFWFKGPAWARRDVDPTLCATAFCFAGWAAIFDGVEAPIPAVVGMHWGVTADKRSVNRMENSVDAEHVRNYALRVLGLTDVEAEPLFGPMATRQRQREWVDFLVRRAKKLQEVSV